MLGAQNVTDINASTTVASGNPRIFCGAVLQAAAADATLLIYDNTSAAGKIIGRLLVKANTNTAFLGPVRIPCNIGIHAAITGASATAAIYYE